MSHGPQTHSPESHEPGSHGPGQRTHTAAIGLTFEEWNTWHGTAKSAGYENTSDWVREVVAAAAAEFAGPAAPAEGREDPKRELARELASIGARLGELTDEINAADASTAQQAALAGADRAAERLGQLAQAVIERW